MLCATQRQLSMRQQGAGIKMQRKREQNKEKCSKRRRRTTKKNIRKSQIDNRIRQNNFQFIFRGFFSSSF